jgi:hypothetical protein
MRLKSTVPTLLRKLSLTQDVDFVNRGYLRSLLIASQFDEAREFVKA